MSGILSDNIGRSSGLVKAAAAGGGWTLGTEQATTSGTSITFTGIPSGTKQIMIMLSQVSLSGGNDWLLTIGDAGGLETSGYYSISGSITSTAGFSLNVGDGSGLVTGQFMLSLEDSANFTWVSSHSLRSRADMTSVGGGDKSLSAELTQVSITSTGGSQTFDSGAANIQYIS